LISSTAAVVATVTVSPFVPAAVTVSLALVAAAAALVETVAVVLAAVATAAGGCRGGACFFLLCTILNFGLFLFFGLFFFETLAVGYKLVCSCSEL
jgi:hypothetical protein